MLSLGKMLFFTVMLVDYNNGHLDHLEILKMTHVRGLVSKLNTLSVTDSNYDAFPIT